MEATALDAYVKHQQIHGHPNLVTAATGVIISHSHPFLAASPDATVYDPSNVSEPYGFIEVKCPFKFQDETPTSAVSNNGFFLKQESDGQLVLKKSHVYFSQVQGQMGVGNRMWCDFVTYTKKGINVQRIHHDLEFWETELLPKLCTFYDMCIAPEIVCPQHPFLGCHFVIYVMNNHTIIHQHSLSESLCFLIFSNWN